MEEGSRPPGTRPPCNTLSPFPAPTMSCAPASLWESGFRYDFKKLVVQRTHQNSWDLCMELKFLHNLGKN